MTGIFLALVLFGAVAAMAAVLRTSDDDAARFVDDVPRRPQPGARDLHAVSGPAFGRAPVPTFG